MTAVEFEGEGLVVDEYNWVVGSAHPTSTWKKIELGYLQKG